MNNTVVRAEIVDLLVAMFRSFGRRILMEMCNVINEQDSTFAVRLVILKTAIDAIDL